MLLSNHFYHPTLQDEIKRELVKHCDLCKRDEWIGQGHAHLPPQAA